MVERRPLFALCSFEEISLQVAAREALAADDDRHLTGLGLLAELFQLHRKRLCYCERLRREPYKDVDWALQVARPVTIGCLVQIAESALFAICNLLNVHHVSGSCPGMDVDLKSLEAV